MDTIFINFENSKRSEPQRLLLNLADKIKYKEKREIRCFIKSWYVLHMEKYKKVVQKQQI